MEIEQIIKQVDWLDDERRKDKSTLSRLEDRILSLEGNLNPIGKQIKDLAGEITRVAALIGRMDQFDDALLQHRIETKHGIEEVQKDNKQRDEESEKIRRVEMRAIEASIVELRKELAPISELKRAMQARIEEESRITRLVDEVRQRIESVRRSDEEYTRTFRLLEDGRRQDSKKITDIQGEVNAIRKQIDEQRGRSDLSSSAIRKIETRLNELSMVEAERREAQLKFLEEQALLQVERERVWKDWQLRFDTIESQTADIDVNLQTLDETHRTVKRSQQSLDELTQKVERRINELTEIQRLAEERFRQEWVTFKADDQKRWTNYTLTQEEQRGESIRQYEKLVERVAFVEDNIQEIQDVLKQINEQTGKRLQAMLAIVHDWVSNFERLATTSR